MPLFLAVGSYINIPLEGSYSRAFAFVPKYWREKIAAPAGLRLSLEPRAAPGAATRWRQPE